MNTTQLVSFLQELAANNSKVWFDDHRDEYQALRQDYLGLVGEVIAGIGETDPAVEDLQPAACLFRINRDVRFSRDKSPYKTQFGAAICPQGRGSGMPTYYFHIDFQGELLVGGGMYAPTSEQIASVRRFIRAHPDQLDHLLANPAFSKTYGQIGGDSLKRPPAGLPADAPHLETLMRKQYLAGKSWNVGEIGEERLAAHVVAHCRALTPFILWLREAVGIDAGEGESGTDGSNDQDKPGPDPFPLDII